MNPKKVKKNEIGEKEEKPRGLFDVINALSKTKELMEGDIDLFDSFMVRKFFSKFPETLFLANEMNEFHFLDKEMQMDFYLFGVTKKSRYSKWFKPPPPQESIILISKQLNVSRKESEVIYSLLSDEEKQSLSFMKGGLQKSKK